jgi:hypothetical protein
MTSEVETNAVAVERIKEYGETNQEAEWEIPERKPVPSWPDKGAITFERYQTRYREGLDLVLRNVTCVIEPGEKVRVRFYICNQLLNLTIHVDWYRWKNRSRKIKFDHGIVPYHRSDRRIHHN